MKSLKDFVVEEFTGEAAVDMNQRLSGSRLIVVVM